MAELLFEEIDPFGVPVRLYLRRWLEHIIPPTRHPEMEPYLELVRQTIANPDFVYRSAIARNTSIFYLLNLKRGRYQNLYVATVVRYTMEQGRKVGTIRTAYFTRTPSGGDELLWIKSKR
jgi:hypothetical protein